jgi:hypothetical protein
MQVMSFSVIVLNPSSNNWIWLCNLYWRIVMKLKYYKLSVNSYISFLYF